ncbi:MAG: DUF3995 domain-containing protein [Inquilinus sp.]|nr:DUF3995 domain-containing protein [Inquilinus sp.]
MTEIVARGLTAVLSIIALIHLYWGLGGIWPARDERQLASVVLGLPNATKLPDAKATLLVAAALAVAAVLPLFVAGILAPPLPRPLIMFGGIAVAMVFWIRGIAAYLPRFRAKFSAEPFATLDRRVYGPLCLLICAGYFTVIFFSPAG